MADPTVALEVEFAAGVWTDIGEHLRSGNTKRGKSKAVGKVPPGSATFVMKNDGRIFDPEYAANISPGNLIPDKNIRAKATYNGITYPIFTGQIDRIIQQYDGPNSAVAVFECSDGLARLAADELGSAWEVQIAATAPFPRAWYRLGEPAGPYAVDRIAGRTGVYVGTPEFSTPSLVGDDDGSFKVISAGDYLSIPAGAFPTAVPWTVSFYAMIDVFPPVGSPTILLLDGNNYPNGLMVWVDSNGEVHARVGLNGVYTYCKSTYLSGGTLFPGSPAMISIQAVATGPPYLRLRMFGGYDTTEVATATGTGGALPVGVYAVGYNSVLRILTMDELIIFDGTPSNYALSRLAIAAGGWSGDLANTRITTVLDAAGWTAPREITTEWDTSLKTTELKESAASHLEKIVATAEGRMWITRDGTLKVISRGEFQSAPYTTSQGTFGDGAGELPYIEMGDYALDMMNVENVVRRSWTHPSTGRESIYEATDSSLAAGTKSRPGELIESEYAWPYYEYDLAALRVAKLSRPLPYVESLRISPRKFPNDLFPQVLGRELSDRLTWIRRPQNVGAAISREVILEGVAHSFSPKRWDTTFYIDATDAFKYFHFDDTLWDAPDWRFSA
ncbi:MAG: hypothetical protein ACR2M4_02945 [Actinomycetota bacterium]